MKIEKPDIYKSESLTGPIVQVNVPMVKVGYDKYESFSIWFEKHVTPFNEMLAEGVRVVDGMDLECWTTKPTGYHTHKALLINVQPIKQDTAEDVLRELIKTYETLKRQEAVDVSYYVDKARAILDRKGEV